MDYLASMYIDDEMDLGEKRQFVEMVHDDDEFYTLTVDLLDQEQRLRQMPAMLPQPVAEQQKWRPPLRHVLASLVRPFGLAAAGFAAAAVLMVNTMSWNPPPAPNSNRFVLYQPAADRVELTGSFTGWQRVAMQRLGASGYWELKLPVPAGEHRFAYILNGERRMADPTLPAVERDDFGGENSILDVEVRI